MQQKIKCHNMVRKLLLITQVSDLDFEVEFIV